VSLLSNSALKLRAGLESHQIVGVIGKKSKVPIDITEISHQRVYFCVVFTACVGLGEASLRPLY